jgi:biopolymer transport protein ExbD
LRRFSQRNSLVTLNEINITPLLDLAFVLLIIFVITTPLLEQSLPVNLPKGGPSDAKTDRDNAKTVEISANGIYVLDKRPMTSAQVEQNLVLAFRRNPNLIVEIRADERGPYKYVYDIMDRCKRNGITKFAFQSQPDR